MALFGRTAIITGAASGIGKACAERFITERANVVVADIDAAAGAKLADRLGDNAMFLRCDTGDAGSVHAMIDTTIGRFGGVDILVNNAGILRVGEFLEITEDDFDAVMRVNLKGYFLVGQAVARAMIDQKSGGAIINMSSVNGITAIPTITAYNVSKGGVDQLTRNMALALAPHDIRVNAIGPGTINTELAQKVMEDTAARRRVLSRTPLGRMGEPAEIAAIALFLATEQSSYITGQIIYADGGRLALNYTVPLPGEGSPG